MKKNNQQQNNWQETTLGKVVDICTGKRDANHGNENGKYPFFTCSQKVYAIDDFNFDTEAVLVAGNGDFNVKYYQGKFDAYQRTYVLNNFKDSFGKFVFYKVEQALENITKNNQGSSVKFIKKGDLENYKFQLPPLTEQKKIADILSSVDEDLEKTEEIILKSEELKKGLMQKLLTRGIGHTKFKKTKLGEIPEEWEVIKFDKLFSESVKNGLNRPTKVRGSGYKMINMGELFAYSKIYNQKMELVPVPEKDKSFLLKNGDLLFARQSLVKEGTGKCSIFLGEDNIITYEGHIIRVRLDKKKVFSEFYYYLFISPLGKNIIKSLVTQTAAAGIRGSELSKVYVPFSNNLQEQKQIAEILSAVDDKINIYKQIKNKLTQLKRGLMQDLLSGGG